MRPKKEFIKNRTLIIYIQSVICILMFHTSCIYALTPKDIPGSADVGRVLQNQKIKTRPLKDTDTPLITPKLLDNEIPPEAENLTFTLKSVTIEGMTVYKKNHFEKMYKDKIGKSIQAAFIWELANHISKTYQDAG